MISTKGRYSIRILLDLAEHGSSGGYTPMKEVAVRQEISLKYIERILPPLKNAGLIASTHGIGGGYRLNQGARDDGVPRVCLGAATQNQPKRTGALSSYNFSKMAFMPR